MYTSSSAAKLAVKCVACHQTHYRLYQGQVFMGEMTQSTVSKH